MTAETGRQTAAKPKTVDAHGHISHVEARDVVDQYDRTFMYGMSHRDNLYLMDAVGVDMQIIQCADPHGTSYEYQHEYVRRVVREHPGRFAAITAIDERKLPSDEGLELIRKHVEDWGFKAWWFAPWPPEELVAAGFDPKEWGEPNPTYYFDHERYDPQWELAQSLGVPVCFTSAPQNFAGFGPALLNVLAKFPDLTVVIVHGFDPPSCLAEDGTVRIPESAVRLVNEYDVYVELLPGLDQLKGNPNRYGPKDVVIKAFYDTFGPSRLMWGSEFTYVEMPTAQQYRHQFDYLKNRCPYMTEDDLAMVRGGNAARVYGL